MDRRNFASFLACTLTGLALTGCTPSADKSASTDTGASAAPAASTAPTKTASTKAASAPFAPIPAGEKITLAFVTNNASDFWTIARAGTMKAQSELPNTTVDFEIPAPASSDAQKTIINNLITKGVKGIAISTIDPKNQTPFLNEVAKKAIVFTQDSDAAGSDRMCYVGTDNRAAGVQAGQALTSALPNGGDVMLFVGNKDAQNAADRAGGIMDAIKGTKIHIVSTRTDDADHARAQANAKDAIASNPNIVGMVGLWSYNGPAIIKAVTEAGKVGKIKIVCFDEEADTLAGVKAGSVEGTVVQNPYEFGHQAIVLMDKVARGDGSVIPGNKTVTIPTRFITKDTVDAFSANLKTLRGK